MTETIHIDLFTDIICPWCLIGTARLDAALAALDPAITVTIAHHPFLLDPSIPDDGQNTRERLKAKYGGDVAAMQARVEQAAHQAGVDLDLSVQPMSYPTIKAHTLIRLAPSEIQYALAKAFAAAYFLEGRNIASDDILLEVAQTHGFSQDDAKALLADEREHDATRLMAHSAGQQGVNGVPFFIFNSKFALSGAQPPEVFARAFRLATGEEALPA
ncbi:DsbA family oxidoreductase [Pelagibacterium lentulum]|uniref:Polyketide synthase n=1 Tax=Pelagibacterium lentulum TaxID=2029865 RepID=A0A916RIE1_9HYPH|nr:DsbA family oxidoreductase [Pelagibacterium lentulum]GGA58392.1 polyketide synthase [Pelagibacterium lentulum]